MLVEQQQNTMRTALAHPLPSPGKYQIGLEIGRGSSGVCYRATAPNGRVYALKKIHLSSIKIDTKQACNQVALLKKVDHPHIIRYLESYSDESYLYIVMQYASKGDLHSILKRRSIRKDYYSEKQIWEMCRQLLSALQYLHGHKIVHRDVKTLNIFVDAQGELFLGDLGVSRLLKQDTELYSRVGTPLYLAPEIIKHEKYGYKADVWGLGCVVYVLAALVHPFQGKNLITLGQNIVYSQQKPVEHYSALLNSFLTDMLQKDPNQRLSSSELMQKYFSSPKITENMISLQNRSSEKGKEFQERTSYIDATSQPSKGRLPSEGSATTKPEADWLLKRERNPSQLKGSRLLRVATDPSCSEKLIFEEADKLKEKQDVEETIALIKKSHLNTRKCMQIASNRQIIFQAEEVPKKEEKDEMSCKMGLKFISEKKLTPCVQPSLDRKESLQQIQKVFPSAFVDVNRLSDSCMGEKRVRPKSSLMNKSTYDTRVRLMKRNVLGDNYQSGVETKILRKPELVMLRRP